MLLWTAPEPASLFSLDVSYSTMCPETAGEVQLC